jgi:hypothetical protein
MAPVAAPPIGVDVELSSLGGGGMSADDFSVQAVSARTPNAKDKTRSIVSMASLFISFSD